MNISIEQANELLRELVGGVQVVADEAKADSEFNTDATIEKINKNAEASIKSKVESELKESVEASLTAKNMHSLRASLARNFGVNKRELEGMEIEDMIQLSKTKQSEVLNQDAKDWEQEREQLIKQHEEELNSKVQELTTQLEESNNKYIQRDINSYMEGIVSNIPRAKGDVKSHTKFAMYELKEQGIELKWDEETKSVIPHKNGEPIRDKGNKSVEIDSLIRPVLDTAGILQKDTRDVRPSDVTSSQPARQPQQPAKANPNFHPAFTAAMEAQDTK